MSTITEAADSLATVFRDVQIRADGSEVRARDHHIMPVPGSCTHGIRIIAKDCFAIIQGGKLVGGDHNKSVLYTKIVYCQRCETVFESALERNR